MDNQPPLRLVSNSSSSFSSVLDYAESKDKERALARALEAIIFASSSPLSVEEMMVRLELKEAPTAALMQLQKDYSARGIQLVQIGKCWTFTTAPDLSKQLTLFREEQRRLSRAAMEVLATIAYHQPVTRAEIEEIRGVSISKGTLDIVCETGWVRPGKRKEVPGRPITYITTNAFLLHFGLGSLSELPGIAELKAAGLAFNETQGAMRNATTHDTFQTENEE